MKKMSSAIVLSVATIALVTGCGVKSTGSNGASNLEMKAHIEKGDETIAKSAIFVGNHKSEDIIKAIRAAGEKEGWSVTEFKSNAVVVEKILGEKTISSVITYHNQHISGDSEHAPMEELLKLRHAIVDELKKEKGGH